MAASPTATLAARLGGRWQAAALGASAFTTTWRADGPGGRLFVKTLPAAQAAVLAAEADGLAALAATGTVRVPAVVGCWCDAGGPALLALEWLTLGPATGAGFGAQLGRALAALHQAPPAEGGGRFGWRCDNHLGATPQANGWSGQGGVGAPPPGFWSAYQGAAGLAAGYPRRRPLYQLYHLLNHALLFGGGYERQALGLAQTLSAAR